MFLTIKKFEITNTRTTDSTFEKKYYFQLWCNLNDTNTFEAGR